jgi:hypothetical protein
MRMRSSLILLVVVLLSACGPGRKARQSNNASYNYEGEYVMRKSYIQIPIHLSRQALEQSINQQMGDVLYEDLGLEGGTLQVRAEKRESISILVDEREIHYRVPLRLWVRKKLPISSAEATGEITLNFKSAYQIDSTWNLSTVTELEGYEWNRKPVIRVVGVDLPVTFIANQILRYTRGKIGRTIDEQVRGVLDLRAEMEQAWAMLQDPIELSEEYRAWMYFNPQSIRMTPFHSRLDQIEASILVESYPRVVIGATLPETISTPLPPFSWTMMGSPGFFMQIQADIPIEEAEDLARVSVVGQRYDQGKRYVVIDNIELGAQEGKLLVKTTLSGSYNGRFDLEGTPRYNTQTNKLEIPDLDVDLRTRNLLFKSAGWLFKGSFRKMIQENIDYYLEDYLKLMRETIQQQFNEMPLGPGIFLDGALSNLQVQFAEISAGNIRVFVDLSGRLAIHMKGLSEEVK